MRVAVHGLLLLVPFALMAQAPPPATNSAPADTVHRGDIDTVVVISARDSVHFNVRRKLMHLRREAVVTFKTQKLEAAAIDMDFNASTMSASGVTDSLGRVFGFPVFTDNGEEFAGESMTYNFSTRRGRVKFGETNVEGGFYYGSRIKRVGEHTAYVENGCYTTCDAPEPHFYFNSPKMKVVMDDKIYLNPVVWYVEDIPVFALPFGLFFSTERGRRSGLIMPSPLLTSDRGVVLQNLGYYFAVSDYFDTEITGDLTTKGGFTLYNRSRWVLRDRFSGNSEVRFGYSRFNVDDPYTMNFGVTLNHQQQLRPQESVSLNLQFTTQQFYQNTSIKPLDRIRQNARSTASYQRTFYNGMTFNANYVRDQNMINGSVTEVPAVSFGIPQIFPIRSLVSGSHWIRDLTFQYRSTARYFNSRLRSADTGAFTTTEYTVIEHRPTLTVTPKLGEFTIQPSVSYQENWYFQRYSQTVNPADSSIVTSRESGFFREYTYGAALTASTFLYGLAHPHILGVAALRHTLQPAIGVQFIPDQSDTTLGFFAAYTSPLTGKTVTYHRYQPAGSLASQQQQTNITFSLFNKFSAKAEQSPSDSVAPKPVDVLTINLASAYNVVADSLRLNPITFSLRSPMLEAVEFACSGTLDAYDQAQVPDPATGRLVWQRIDRSLIQAGKGLVALKGLSLQLGTRFGSEGVSFERSSIVEDTTKKDSVPSDLRSRFNRRINYEEEDTDLFADHTPGWSGIAMPWDVALALSYTLSKPNPEITTESLLLSFRGNLSITQSLMISAVGSIDMLTGRINSPVIDISKQIHCWQLSLNWVPTGANQGFYLRFAASAPQLQGLMFPKQSTPLYR
jgi:hypothetical protein